MNDIQTNEFHRFTLRINKALFLVIKEFAKKNKRAIGKEIEFALENCYQKQN